MELYSESNSYKLYHGNMLDMLEVIESGTIDSIVTDPPYELNFMGKGWDNSGIAFQPDTWKRCLDALKPGGYLLAFGGSRTYHRIACAIEDAGFEIRDCIMWLYGSGFPKSLNIGKGIESKLLNGTANPKDFKNLEGEKHSVTCGFNATGKETGYRDKEYEMTKIDVEYKTELGNKYKGWGTALKPSYEPIIVARKPLEGSCTDNVIKYGVGGINIDECRVGNEERFNNPATIGKDGVYNWNQTTNENEDYKGQTVNGRFPANTILTYDESDFEEVCGGFPDTKSGSKITMNSEVNRNEDTTNWSAFNGYKCGHKPNGISNYGDSGNASRYFYNAKASKRDRDEGLDGFEAKTKVFNGQSDKSSEDMKDVEKRFTTVGRNVHPCVKPTSLMQYLVRLVTPNGGTVLDPFNGSGSTGKAVMYENKDRNKNYKYIGIELTEEYLPIAKARIEYVINKGIEKEKEEEKAEGLREQPLFF